jgi:hypothetical protein
MGLEERPERGTTVVDDLRFKTLLDAYGADVERWPASEREAGRTRMAAARAAGSAEVEAAAALDALLAEAPPAVVRSPLVGRILASAEQNVRTRSMAGGVLALGADLRARILAASVLLVALGVLAGWSAGHSMLGPAAAGDALLASAYGGTADDMFAVGGL